MKKFFTLFVVALATLTTNAQEVLYSANIHSRNDSVVSALTTDARIVEYEDSVVIEAFDGKEGHNLTCTWNDEGWNAINGESCPWVYVHNNDTFYGGYFYTGKYMGGGWDETGGEFWIGAYLYYTDQSITSPKWTYIDWKWTADDITTTGITTVKEKSKNSAIYDLTGRKVTTTRKGLYIQNGKKYMMK